VGESCKSEADSEVAGADDMYEAPDATVHPARPPASIPEPDHRGSDPRDHGAGLAGELPSLGVTDRAVPVPTRACPGPRTVRHEEERICARCGRPLSWPVTSPWRPCPGRGGPLGDHEPVARQMRCASAGGDSPSAGAGPARRRRSRRTTIWCTLGCASVVPFSETTRPTPAEPRSRV